MVKYGGASADALSQLSSIPPVCDGYGGFCSAVIHSFMHQKLVCLLLFNRFYISMDSSPAEKKFRRNVKIFDILLQLLPELYQKA